MNENKTEIVEEETLAYHSDGPEHRARKRRLLAKIRAEWAAEDEQECSQQETGTRPEEKTRAKKLRNMP